ncbi:hypothetical protein Tco_0543132 [Tanacetum coccineum]
MSTLAEHIIVAGEENRPPMLDKSMYDSWASHILLLIKGKKHGRMMFDSIHNGLLFYPIVEENGQIRTKKYSKLTEAEQLQDDCDVQATNILLHYLPPDVYALVNHHEAAKAIWDKVKGSSTNSRGNPSAGKPRVVKCYNYQGEGHMARQYTQPKRPRNDAWFKEKIDVSRGLGTFQTKDFDAYDSNSDDLSSAKAVLMENLSSCDSDVLSEAMHMLRKPQVFYDDTHKQALAPVKIEDPRELPKVILVNESLKKLGYELASFDKVVKKRTTSDAITAGVNCFTSASGSKPSGNTKKNRISQSASRNKTNKVEDHFRSVKSRKNKNNPVDKTDVMQSVLNANSVSEPISNAFVKHYVKNAKFESVCASWSGVGVDTAYPGEDTVFVSEFLE